METSNLTSEKTNENLNTLSTITIKSSSLSISPQKMKEVAKKIIRGQNLDYLLRILPFLPTKGSSLILELLQKEVKYWEKKGLRPSDFYVHKTQINQGSTRKKIIFRAKGRADRLRRRSSLVEIQLKNINMSKIQTK